MFEREIDVINLNMPDADSIKTLLNIGCPAVLGVISEIKALNKLNNRIESNTAIQFKN